ncbi:hypothetical protein NCAS_0B03890 [Naumovozyma castellii]|uniref:Transmembrane 9 superfamily member n=1 Tax=Naumovozyma castellii TaxID=27288 RepID=G0V9Y8_NAUCA|nr:hypothetical protein NCAS_0B03890 [Naumovozyma castellii CBS 4309]CCC68473.1 hypothetical protein NCAS_0B03890 [Naumovozyma castellii CBS 4309]
MNYVILSLLFCLSVVEAFNLPGLGPVTYQKGDDIPLLVNHLTPSMHFHHKNEEGKDISTAKKYVVHSYDYYYEKFHFCQPVHIEKAGSSIGSILFGDRIYNSPFQLNMLENKTCVPLCESIIPGKDAEFINKLIKNGYYQNWFIDGLPAAREVYDKRTKSSFYGNGFELGLVEIRQTTGDKLLPDSVHDISDLAKRDAKNLVQNLIKEVEVPYFVNHFDIVIEYHERGNGNYRVVGATVNPVSIARKSAGDCTPTGKSLTLNEEEDNNVHSTYSVTFVPSKTSWVTRWDKYLHVYDPKIQWFSLINFSLIVILLSVILINSLLKALKSDFARYNNINLDDDVKEESGWKLVHGYVFRIPKNPMILSILVGSGFQLFLVIVCTVFLAAIDILSPIYRGALPTAMIILYILFGFISSYVSMGVYKFFKGPYWKVNMLLTPILVPGLIIITFLALNLFLMFSESSSVVPAKTIMTLILLWFAVSIPLSVAGSLMAQKKCHWDEHPTVTNQIAKVIPPQKWYLKTIPASLIGGLFSFGSISVQLYFIYTSLWFNNIFYMYGFLLFSICLFTMTITLVTILFTYHSLCQENWKWQWRGFFIGGLGCSIYVLLHSLFFIELKLGGFTNILLYMGYSSVVTALIFLVTGSVGFLSSMFFIKRIFSSVKVD